MWNERYSSDEYIYGTQPNVFLAENATLLTGPVLSLAEGEGRNAVFLASLGLDVLGVDSSELAILDSSFHCCLINCQKIGLGNASWVKRSRPLF